MGMSSKYEHEVLSFNGVALNVTLYKLKLQIGLVLAYNSPSLGALACSNPDNSFHTQQAYTPPYDPMNQVLRMEDCI